MSEAARSRRGEARYEPQVNVPGYEAAASAGASDPLAELARLIGQDDPYRDVFQQRLPEGSAEAAHVNDQHGYAGDEDRPHEGYHDPAENHEPVEAESYDPRAQGGGHLFDDGQGYEAYSLHDAGHAHDARHDAVEPAATYAEDGGRENEVPTASSIPDLWVSGEDGQIWPTPDADPAAPVASGSFDRSAARRPLAVLAAVLLLTGGGLAATFLARGGSAAHVATANTGRAAPTILAATGPTKVKVDDGSATAPEDQDAALLNKNGNVSSGPVKIVSSQEQPADLGQLPKADIADGARPLPPPPPSPFPEAKKVKTFLVHPDGTMLSADGTPVAAAQTTASGSLSPPADDVPAAARPATPPTSAKGTATPLAAAPPVATLGAAIASLSADTATADAPVPTKPVRQPASPGARAAKPSKTAAASAPTGGSYGIQLASSPVEADANAAFAKLKKKYPDQLGPYSATVHRAETGDKPVYRVRVGGMSQDEAKTLCSQLQTAGGTCYVVHN